MSGIDENGTQPAEGAEAPERAADAAAAFDDTQAAFRRATEGATDRAAADAERLRAEQQNLAVILGVPVKMQVVLGAATMPVASLLKLGRGAVVELDHKVGEPVSIMINDRVIARGEVVVVEEDRFGVTLTDIVVDPFPGAAAATI